VKKLVLPALMSFVAWRLERFVLGRAAVLAVEPEG
jgi:hypothetical protein